ASITSCPASRTRLTAVPTASVIVPSSSRIVPSMSSATSQLSMWLEDLNPAEVRTQRLGHSDGAVRLLMSFEDRDYPARRSERAVQGGDRRGASRLGAVADVEPPSLVGGAVAGRGQLAIGALGWHPGLDVELAGGGRPEVAGRDI